MNCETAERNQRSAQNGTEQFLKFGTHLWIKERI
jgi:hypothetical protein